MKLFDKKFVYFKWDDTLEGKKGFFADSIAALRRVVEANSIANFGFVTAVCDDYYPFAADVGSYTFFYYDPNYDCKRAYAEGKQIQYQNSDGNWMSATTPSWDIGTIYRVAPEPQKKLRPFRDYNEFMSAALNGTPVTPTTSALTPVVTLIRKNANIATIVTSYDLNNLNAASPDSVAIYAGGEWRSFDELLNDFKFLNGMPCGVEE